MLITDMVFESVPDRGDGLIGFVEFNLGGLRLGGISVRRTLLGRHALSFPQRRDRAGNTRFAVRPLDDRTRRDLERQVLGGLGLLGEEA